MRLQFKFIDFVLKEWLVIASGVGLIITSLFTKHFPSYAINEIEVLFVLLILFVVINGLRNSGLILRIAQIIERGRAISLKLVVLTFFLSMLVTNDISLMVIVPLTLSLNVNRKDILIILEALAANAGSALTPIGNPQNIYIYWFYNLSLSSFVKVIAPFSIFFLVLLVIFSILIKVENSSHKVKVIAIDKTAYIYGVFFIIVLLTVLRFFPVYLGSIVLLFALIFDRKVLKIDYALLLSFFFFFGIADNLKIILTSEITHSGHIFLFSALISQVMSNVPATLLFAKFTSNWQALLWGANAGGFGSLFGSLANLIAYKLYVTHKERANVSVFTVKFLVIGYTALLLSIGLYFLLDYVNILP